jgi:hypothetical protein
MKVGRIVGVAGLISLTKLIIIRHKETGQEMKEITMKDTNIAREIT